MKFDKLKTIISVSSFVMLSLSTPGYSELMILSDCKDLKDGFIKNEYILDLKKSLMTRNYIYDSKTYKKQKITDLSIKKKNSIERFIYEEENLILTDKIGYPQFFTQLVFKKNSPIINIKTVINNEVGISKLSTCKKVELFEEES
tara:strand:- start:619 stop:1053 length:435 start_codon:yes stop_codon:yes gene_type:complete